MGDVQTIGVIGGGTMGNGIAHVAANSGVKVMLLEVEQRFLDRAQATIAKNLNREVAKNKISEDDKSSAIERISGTLNSADMAKADFIIEAIVENEGLKSKIFAEMDAITRPGVILASNTSSISVTKIASKTKRPDKVIGMHFMNPVPVMTLVEIVRGLATSDDPCRLTRQL